GGASEDAVATTPAPNPHNQTTSAQTEVTGRVLFSFCVVFCKFGFCIKCVSVSLGFSLAPSLMWNPKMEPVKMLWTAKVMMWLLSPQHPIPTTRQLLHKLKLLVGCFFLVFVCVVFCQFGFCIKCVSLSLGFSLAPSLMWNPKMAQVKMLRTAKVMMWLSPQHPIPTTRPHLHILKLVVRFSFAKCMCSVESCVEIGRASCK